MRDKNRIEPLIKEIRNCLKTTKGRLFYDLLFELYHDDPEQWTDYYKEDDYWKIYISNYRDDNLDFDCLYNSVEPTDFQEDILRYMEQIWKANYDLRFPQICNLVYYLIGDKTSDKEILEILKEKAGGLNGNR